MKPSEASPAVRLLLDRVQFRVLQGQVTKYGMGSQEARLALGRIDRLLMIRPEWRGEPLIAGEKKDYWLEDQAVEDQIRENFPDVLAPVPVYDPRRPCPKCGKTKARTQWINDRLHRTCKRCSFGWVELPLPESAPESEPSP